MNLLKEPLFQLACFLLSVMAVLTWSAQRPIKPLDSAGISLSIGTLAELAATGRVTLHAADEQTLEALPGIGPKTAAQIIQWRNSQIKPLPMKELTLIPGIGPRTLQKIQDYLQ